MAAPLSPNLDWGLANPLWAQSLNPIINNPIIQGMAITNIFLIANTEKTINHGLGRMMIEWFLIDTMADANVWRTKPLNSKTLSLEASSNTTISIWTF
jgi:hypothetical protein